MKLYLSGPITGIENNNIEVFAKAASDLREAGFDIVNPLELPQPPELKKVWNEYMRLDLIEMLTHCHGVVVLDGWEGSKGARGEVYLAQLLDWPVFTIDCLLGALVVFNDLVV